MKGRNAGLGIGFILFVVIVGWALVRGGFFA